MTFDVSSVGQADLQDARAMRALAHPTRLAILDFLHLEGAATATRCGAAVGQSPSCCSYHLRTLAKWGFVEEAEGGHGRERPWQVKLRGLRWSTAAGSSDQRAAAALLRDQLLTRDDAILEAFLEHEESLPTAWREAASLGNATLHVTPAELRDLTRRIRSLLQPFYRVDPSNRPLGARAVHIVYRAIPRRE
jgi:DNA-binding transcriptional ArsR family regulator